MPKAPKPDSARKLPVPSESHADIDDWIRRVMPDLHPIIKRLDELIRKTIPGLQFAVKWKKAYYGLPELGWIIEMGRLRRLGERRLPRRRGLRLSAAARNHRTEPLRQGQDCGGSTGTGDAQVDRAGGAPAGLEVEPTSFRCCGPGRHLTTAGTRTPMRTSLAGPPLRRRWHQCSGWENQ